MLILILETSCEKSAIILTENEVPVAFKALTGGPNLSKNLALEVKNLIGDRKPELVAVGVGPGSYTGIRVGAALAKGLSYGWGVPLLGFCSLKAFGPAPVVVDARGGGFYALLGEEAEIVGIQDVRLRGEIRSPHPDLIRKRLESEAVLKESGIDPEAVARLVWSLFLEGKAGPLELNYLSHP